ncbi:MAG: class I SAM-dependent methyltransferase [Chloroflexota bacterium]
MQQNNYFQANEADWDRKTELHQHAPFYDLAGFKQGKDRLRSIESEELGDVRGKSMLHLQCHFGMDTMAWARRGAVVTGVDFSPKAIALAKSLSQELNIPATFVCANVYDLVAALRGTFDIVFTSYGVLHYLPDLGRWAETIAHYLNPGGIFYIVEDHPTFRIFRSKSEGEFRAERPYFHHPTPEKYVGKASYAIDDDAKTTTQYIWNHHMGDILNSLINAGLHIDFLHEFPFAARAKFPHMVQGEDGWWRLPERHGTVPFLFSLQAHKLA